MKGNTKMATKKLKSAALQVQAAQSKQDVTDNIRTIGDLQRDAARLQAEMNDKIAVIQAEYAPQIEPLTRRIEGLQNSVQAWCEANRDDLTAGGKIKTADFVTGKVSWRLRPTSCSVKGAEAVIELLKTQGLGRFVRVKEEVNKEACLNEQDAVRGVAGISFVSGKEDFVIEPFEQELSAA